MLQFQPGSKRGLLQPFVHLVKRLPLTQQRQLQHSPTSQGTEDMER